MHQLFGTFFLRFLVQYIPLLMLCPMRVKENTYWSRNLTVKIRLTTREPFAHQNKIEYVTNSHI